MPRIQIKVGLSFDIWTGEGVWWFCIDGIPGSEYAVDGSVIPKYKIVFTFLHPYPTSIQPAISANIYIGGLGSSRNDFGFDEIEKGLGIYDCKVSCYVFKMPCGGVQTCLGPGYPGIRDILVSMMVSAPDC